MCEWTVPNSMSGRDKHRRKRGEKPCDECREAFNAWYRNYRAGKPQGTWRANHLWALYRIRMPDYERILEAQGNCCGICGKAFRSPKSTHMDHRHGCNHEGKGYVCCRACVRGVLCTRCNTALAFLEDTALHHRALDYLRSYACGGEVMPA